MFVSDLPELNAAMIIPKFMIIGLSLITVYYKLVHQTAFCCLRGFLAKSPGLIGDITKMHIYAYGQSLSNHERSFNPFSALNLLRIGNKQKRGSSRSPFGIKIVFRICVGTGFPNNSFDKAFTTFASVRFRIIWQD